VSDSGATAGSTAASLYDDSTSESTGLLPRLPGSASLSAGSLAQPASQAGSLALALAGAF
jgi:hypothetical protein